MRGMWTGMVYVGCWDAMTGIKEGQLGQTEVADSPQRHWLGCSLWSVCAGWINWSGCIDLRGPRQTRKALILSKLMQKWSRKTCQVKLEGKLLILYYSWS